jgi:transposase
VIRSVGVDFGIVGPNRVRCLDEQAQLCGSFSFRSGLEGLAAMEERIFQNGANPTIVFEPTGLAWLLMAIYLKARHPDCRLVRAKIQKVAALRKYLRGRSKSDQIDALTLAKMPFIASEQLDEFYLLPVEVHALQRLTRQHDLLKKSIGSRKSRLGATIDGYLPGLRHASNNHWSLRARAFYCSRINSFAVVRAGEETVSTFLNEAMPCGKGSGEAPYVYMACQDLVTTYALSMQSGVADEGFFADLQDEIARELRLMEVEEAEAERLSKRIEELYQKLHPRNHLRSIPGVGEHTALIFLAGVGNPHRFRNQSAFANWNGVVPGARQSSDLEAKGPRMTKAGPPIMRCSLFLAGEVSWQ